MLIMAGDFASKTDKELQESLDAFLVPGMMNLNVLGASDVIGNMWHEMRESKLLCRRLDTRLSYLRSHPRKLHEADKVSVFASTLG
uniref:Uncharacterized protein n=1 Tax=Globisporangium ultimum (strain ATCC 200006 / CBS 805.95 / DAOM BR144) TaxID=431595 RepID=K3X5G3_GLOUD